MDGRRYGKCRGKPAGRAGLVGHFLETAVNRLCNKYTVTGQRPPPQVCQKVENRKYFRQVNFLTLYFVHKVHLMHFITFERFTNIY